MLDTELVAILRCPVSGGPLHYLPEADGLPGFGPGVLYCPESRLKYPVDELDFPVLLVDEAVEVSEAEAEALRTEVASRKPSGS